VKEEMPKEVCGQEHDGGAEGYGGILEVTCKDINQAHTSFDPYVPTRKVCISLKRD
jgi:hypothetical protein